MSRQTESMAKTTSASARKTVVRSRGYWAETWRRYCRNPPAVLAMLYVIFTAIVAICSPMIAGTKPVVCRYKGELYFPCIGYFYRAHELATQVQKDMRGRYSPQKFAELDEKSWVVWPLFFQDPYRRIRSGEWQTKGKDGEWIPGEENLPSAPPTFQNPFGTSEKGFDIFAVIVHGARSALLIGLISTGISALIGILLGATAGYFGGAADFLLSRLTEIVLCLPRIVVLLAITSVLEKPTIWHTMAILGALGWPTIARLTRAEFLRLKSVDYVTAARALGARPMRVIFRHILPNALAPVLVPIAFGISGAILIENSLAFLGFGRSPPSASWGELLNQAQSRLDSWWMIVFPGLAIFLTVLSYNLIGEGLQQATDPRLRESTK